MCKLASWQMRLYKQFGISLNQRLMGLMIYVQNL